MRRLDSLDFIFRVINDCQVGIGQGRYWAAVSPKWV